MAERKISECSAVMAEKGRPTSFRRVFEGSCEDIIHQTVNATAEMLMMAVNKS